MYQSLIQQPHHTPWNKGKLSGQKRPLKLQEMTAACHSSTLSAFDWQRRLGEPNFSLSRIPSTVL